MDSVSRLAKTRTTSVDDARGENAVGKSADALILHFVSVSFLLVLNVRISADMLDCPLGI